MANSLCPTHQPRPDPTQRQQTQNGQSPRYPKAQDLRALVALGSPALCPRDSEILSCPEPAHLETLWTSASEDQETGPPGDRPQQVKANISTHWEMGTAMTGRRQVRGTRRKRGVASLPGAKTSKWTSMYAAAGPRSGKTTCPIPNGVELRSYLPSLR